MVITACKALNPKPRHGFYLDSFPASWLLTLQILSTLPPAMGPDTEGTDKSDIVLRLRVSDEIRANYALLVLTAT